MLKGDWRTPVIAGLVLTAAFAIAGFILGSQLGHEAGQRDAKTQEYARHAAEEIENSCVGLGGDAELECIIRVVEATNGHERAENDLVAQRNMARWAFLMLLATIAMAITTVFGVYYVWRTLVATQKMANDTREIGEAQVRAYVSFEFEHIAARQPVLKAISEQEGPPNLVIEIEGRYKNSGQSPAIQTNLLYDIRAVERSFSHEDLDTDYLHDAGAFSKSIPAGSEVPTSFKRTFTADIDRLRTGELVIWFVIAVKYMDVFGEINMSQPMSGCALHLFTPGMEKRIYWDRLVSLTPRKQEG